MRKATYVTPGTGAGIELVLNSVTAWTAYLLQQVHPMTAAAEKLGE